MCMYYILVIKEKGAMGLNKNKVWGGRNGIIIF